MFGVREKGLPVAGKRPHAKGGREIAEHSNHRNSQRHSNTRPARHFAPESKPDDNHKQPPKKRTTCYLTTQPRITFAERNGVAKDAGLKAVR